MAHLWAASRAPNYEQWAGRQTPKWFKDAKLGIFIHWGTYSVPAFAENSGELGHIDEAELFPHNPYAEWYYNTIRFPEGEATKYHKNTYGDVPYDSLLDKWSANQFDADKLSKLFARAGAEYVVPVSKHHDGITLWDAPGTGTRNTVHRGPKRDLIEEFAKGAEANGLKFGVYYSTGIDWHKWPTPGPWRKDHHERPGIDDHEYNEYAWKHCEDLIKRHKPYVLWGDIDWPKSGVAPGPYSVEALLKELYGANPEAVINDRFGDTHWDFCTVEYGLGEKPKAPQMWQSCRGIGMSFGYNQMETEKQYMSGVQAIQLLVDVAAQGGNLLLNVGPDEAGNIPDLQLKCLEYMAEYMAVNGNAIQASDVVDESLAKPTGEGESKDWVRWLRKDSRLFAFVVGSPKLDTSVDLNSGKLLSGEVVKVEDGRVVGEFPLQPVCIEFAAYAN